MMIAGGGRCAPFPRPRVFVGETRSRVNLAALRELGWGRMFVTRRPTPYELEDWGFDNGAFVAWRKGEPFPESDFLRRLDDAMQVRWDPCLAVTPDLVARGIESLEFSLAWRTGRRLPADWPWYLAVQDGMTAAAVEPHLHLFRGLFLGGTNQFKAATAWRWRQLAHKHQLQFHYGRAGTPAKLLSAYKVGADSCDSAFPLWTAERMRIFTARWRGLPDQAFLPYGDSTASPSCAITHNDKEDPGLPARALPSPDFNNLGAKHAR